jgi:uncharacterized membrane protein
VGALAVSIIVIFKRDSVNGWDFLFRWAHVLAGITWIGLLYYFNFVQVPAFAELDAPVRNSAIDKLASRALWWFRWAAAATLGLGILLLAVNEKGAGGGSRLTDGDYYKSAEGIAISTGILLAVTMFANVWLVIWPNQKKVIANARNVLSGGEADPDAAAAGRKAALASRQNTIFSFTMLFFMVGAAHFFGGAGFDVHAGSNRGIYWAITLVVWLVLELNCLGVIGGTTPQGTNWIYEDHKRAIGTGLVLVVFWYLLWVLIF